MLRGASKFRVAAFLALFAFWVYVLTVAHSAHAMEYRMQAGVDAWQTSAPVRYLPNYATTHDWRPVNPWVKGTVDTGFDTLAGYATFTAQGQYNPVTGGRIDRLDADLRMTDTVGVRAGIVPFRVSWCRSYATNSMWVSEPDAFCRHPGLNEMNQGAAGAQVYKSGIVGGWLVDGMAGIYRPMIDGQDQRLGPYVAVGPTVMHRKVGASLNAINLNSGVQLRAAWLRTAQDQDSSEGGYQRRMRYDTVYLAAEGNVTRSVDLWASLAQYVGDQINPATLFSWDGRSITLEASYKLAPGQSLALGLSRYQNLTTYVKAPHNQSVTVPSVSVAYRHDLADGWHYIVQATKSNDSTVPRSSAPTDRQGGAFGVRVARSF